MNAHKNKHVSCIGVSQSIVAFRIQRGDRPDPNQIDVQKAAGLDDLVDLMKRCWHQKPKSRPSFEGSSTFVVKKTLFLILYIKVVKNSTLMAGKRNTLRKCFLVELQG